MHEHLKPINPTTPKEEFVRQLEDLILAGRLNPGEKLPPERDLAETMKVSRPVVHEGLLDLEAKGLITMKPRHGCWINDYRRSGSLELLNALYRYNSGALEPHLDEGLEELRRIILQAAAARLLNMEKGGTEERKRRSQALDALKRETEAWAALETADPEDMAEADFRFYFALVYHSGNPIFPLLLNSARQVYIGLLGRFFAHPGAWQTAGRLKGAFLDALRKGSPEDVRYSIAAMSSYASYGRTYGE